MKDKTCVKLRKKNSEIKDIILEELKTKEEISINELSKKINSNWSTVNKCAEQMVKDGVIIEFTYKKIKTGIRIKKLTKIEKELLNIILEEE